MINHVWGLLAHPSTEFKEIKRENESVSHLYTHHVLLMALIPVVCAFIGTTQLGWLSGAGHAIRLDMPTALYTAAAFYLLILAGVAVMGKVIHWMARRYEARRVCTAVWCLPAISPRRCSSAALWRCIRWYGCACSSG
ncbi:Inner membrane protein yohC [Serratia rubidaea]|uniref:Inner membrane protein yohC n=1 Tax=Serratia rubidaea TaxID=61652 RepID=A0A4U9HBC8_SERRU|nr:Inner membrane protein yohC [Serratia rubidaea]